MLDSMLDADMIEQLKGVLGRLERPVTLSMATSKHAAQPELLAMLEGLTSTSPPHSSRRIRREFPRTPLRDPHRR